MFFHIPDRAKILWDEWDLRTAVLVSLFFQVVLIFSAGSRKRRGSGLPMAVVWTFYLLADWIAAFAVGLIVSASGQPNNCPQNPTIVSQELAVFWAPFLLLHLGGPDAITAFSLEDNELWIRHLLGLIAQLVAVIYVFFQYSNDQFLLPTVLMFLAGAFKYAERTRALYQACLGNFKSSLLPKPDAGPNYAQLMEEYSAMEASNVPVKIDIVKEPEKAGLPNNDSRPISPGTSSSTDMEIVLNGYKFFNIFKGLIVDDMFSFHERNESRAFFFQRKAADAFRVLEVELNFMYDSLYTKMAVINSAIGYLLRVTCSVLIVVCFQQFASHPQHNIALFDKIVTYILLSGAVLLDLVASVNLVFSDWTTVLAPKWAASVILSMRPAPFTKRRQSRWSNAMSQHSLISFCLHQRRRWLEATADLLGIKDTLDEFKYKGSIACEENLKEFIFEELKLKAEKAQTIKLAKEIYSARGEWVLLNYPAHYSYPSILSSVSDQEVEYDESLLLWHVATELCYSDSNSTQLDTTNNIRNHRRFCKVLSDYMLYLLVMRPTLMSAVAGIAQIRFADTCEEAKKFFQRWESELISPQAVDEGRRSFLCEKLMNVKTVVRPKEVKGDRSKSVLFDACILANELKKLDEVRRWEMMSRVWVELLSYGASHCRASAHARELSKGGELITFVWLQMAHFGLGEQFRIEAGHARAKLLVGK